MIPLENWVPDELHIMLRIWDYLWSLVISELKEYDLCREEIIQEMNQIGVKFQFWKEKEANVWNYTSLMGDDKLKVLKNFNLSRILPPSRARKIRELWDRRRVVGDILNSRQDYQSLDISSAAAITN
ncbi:hypothetical protein C1646_766158 [Rhizophagus diaphanus]|nr:hypothetical protein C1646_766158 [Rhizophagus diaphanus] [Rhizophagus sp. MUCL 43196]